VDNIVTLRDIYHVGEVRLHSAFLFDPTAFARQMALGIDFGLDRVGGETLLTQVAMHGDGTFTEFSAGSSINFFNVNYTSIKSESSLAQLFAWNENSWLYGQGLVVDTDGDGLADTTEVMNKSCAGLNPGCTTPTDSDGDGYSDLIETLNLSAGFDPRDPKKPATACVARQDTDGDGLRDCEEAVLGTDPRLFDSDADRIPDLIEVRAGMNPLDPNDAFADANHNGVRNIDEVRAHLNPMTAGPPASEGADDHYINEVTGSTAMDDGRTCYDFTVRNVRLLTTGAGTQSTRGENKIHVYFIEAPLDHPADFGNLHVGCVRARYVDGVLKSPPTGEVHLSEDRFKVAGRFSDATDCVDLTSLTASTGSPDGGPVDGGTSD
jgi:hypothetical protein